MFDSHAGLAKDCMLVDDVGGQVGERQGFQAVREVTSGVPFWVFHCLQTYCSPPTFSFLKLLWPPVRGCGHLSAAIPRHRASQLGNVDAQTLLRLTAGLQLSDVLVLPLLVFLSPREMINQFGML